MKRYLLTTMALLLALAMLAGCATNAPSAQPTASAQATIEATATPEATEPPAEELKQVNLIWYALGDKPKDFEEVFAKINEKSAADLKCTVETKFISWADFATKYALVFASGEKFDMIYTSSWSYYAQQAVKNGFMELTPDLLVKYAPNCMSQIPEDAWSQAKINGKVYMIPNTIEQYNHLGILIRGDLREKYGLPEIKTLGDFEKYLDTIAINEKGLIPYDGGSDFDSWTLNALEFLQPNGLYEPVTGYVCSLTDPKAELKKKADMPEYVAYLKKMREFNQLNYWSRNALNNKVSLQDSFLNGKSASALHNLEAVCSTWRKLLNNHPEWKPEVFDSMENFPTIRNSYLGNGMGIFAKADNPERALMWIDKVRFDESYYDLMMSGIEGKHWKNEGPGKMSSGPASLDYGGFSNWGFNTQPMIRIGIDEWPKLREVYASWGQRAVICPVFYMSFDDSNVKNETAAISNVTRKYKNVLEFGFDKDPEKLSAEYEQQLDAAGREKMVKEWVAQRDAYLASYTK